MKIGKRKLSKFFKALTKRHHYESLFFMFLISFFPFDFFLRYFFGIGNYPKNVFLRSPVGKLKILVYSYWDVLTVNEIFFRRDYGAKKDIRVVVDLGSNIGISALYFLSRNDFVKCYLFEPDPNNIERLKDNLVNFNSRFFLKDSAIDGKEGFKKFGIDPNGRCGGLNRKSDKYIKVKCLDINKELENIIVKEGRIDILKIDIEGDEIKILEFIKKENLLKINTIYFEIDYSFKLNNNFSYYPEIFTFSRRGETCMLLKK